jgi:precorrin-6A/cobalt-precorrin-6A reductase
MRVLILGGTTEATALSLALSKDARFAALLSYAGATRAPRPAPTPWRVGGFGGPEGLARFLTDGGYHALIDATHPFATRMKHNAIAAAALSGVAFLAVDRPAWKISSGDHWSMVANMPQAALAIGAERRRVLLTIGQKDLAAFLAAPQHAYLVRSVDPPAPESLPPDAISLPLRGPFLLQDEIALLQEHRIEVIVTKNSGGRATEPKLAAARQLGIQIVMVERPPRPDWTETADDPESALAWLHQRIPTERGA